MLKYIFLLITWGTLFLPQVSGQNAPFPPKIVWSTAQYEALPVNGLRSWALSDSNVLLLDPYFDAYSQLPRPRYWTAGSYPGLIPRGIAADMWQYDYSLTETFLSKNKITLLLEKQLSGTRTAFFLREMSPVDFSLSPKTDSILAINYIPDNKYFAVSPDSTHVLMMVVRPVSEKSQFIYDIAILDLKDHKIDFLEKLLLPYEYRDIVLSQILLSNNGEIYILGQRLTNRTAAPNHHTWEYFLVSRKINEEAQTISQIEANEGNVQQLIASLNQQQQLVLAGISGKPADGFLFNTFSHIHENLIVNKIKLSNNVFQFIYSPSPTLSQAPGLRIAQIQPYSDGDFAIIGYQSVNTTEGKATFAQKSTIVCRVSPQGQLRWMSAIPVSRPVANIDAPLAAGILMKNDTIGILYTDNLQNIMVPSALAEAQNYTFKQGSITLARLSPTGELARFPVDISSESKIICQEKQIFVLSNHTNALLIGSRRGHSRIVIGKFIW